MSYFQITSPSQSYVDGTYGLRRPVKVYLDRFTLAGVAPAGTAQTEMRFKIKKPDTTSLTFAPTRSDDATYNSVTRRVLVALCVVGRGDVNDRDTYSIILEKLNTSSGMWEEVGTAVTGVQFAFAPRGPDGKGSGLGYEPDILFPDDGTPHSRWGFSPYGLVTYPSETVTTCGVVLGTDTADYAETPYYTDLLSFWWSVFYVVDPVDPTLRVTSSITRTDTASGLSFMD